MEFEDLDYPEFSEILEEASNSVVRAQKSLDQAFIDAVREGKGEALTPTRYFIPRMELEYRTIFSVRRSVETEKKKLVVIGPKKIKEDKYEVEALSRVRIEMIAVPPEATGEKAPQEPSEG